jgi:hypothetical protein
VLVDRRSHAVRRLPGVDGERGRWSRRRRGGWDRWPGSGKGGALAVAVARSFWSRRVLPLERLVQHGQLSEIVAATLAAHAPDLARHWLERALAATPRRVAPAAVPAAVPAGAHGGPHPADPDAAQPDAAHAEEVVRALASSLRSSEAASLVLVGDTAGAQAALDRASQAQDARPAGEVMRLGWSTGRATRGAAACSTSRATSSRSTR